MSQYVTLTLNYNTINKITEYLEEYCERLDNYYDIEEVVHLIDFLNEEIDDYHAQQNKIWNFINDNEERYEIKDDIIYDKLNDKKLSNYDILLLLNEKEREKLLKELQ